MKIERKLHKNSKRLRPYAVERKPIKYTADKTEYVPGTLKGVSKFDKLITKNANRAIKKAFRQRLKKELQDELRQYTRHTSTYI